MNKYFYLAGTILCVNANEEYIAKEFSDFAILEDEAYSKKEWDMHISVECKVNENMQVQAEEILCSETMRVLETAELFILQYPQNRFVLKVILDKKSRNAALYTNESEVDTSEVKYSLRDIFFYYIQQEGKIAIHSASIVYHGKAWLFSAPAGTGKSTHVDLWKQLGCPMEDLNGDLAVCYQDEDFEVWAASTPWCGTSDIYCNKQVPLGGVVFLNRGWQNQIRELSIMEGVLRLAARSISPAWISSQAEHNLIIAEQVGKKTLLVELMCLPEIEAAKLMKDYIDKSNK